MNTNWQWVSTGVDVSEGNISHWKKQHIAVLSPPWLQIEKYSMDAVAGCMHRFVRRNVFFLMVQSSTKPTMFAKNTRHDKSIFLWLKGNLKKCCFSLLFRCILSPFQIELLSMMLLFFALFFVRYRVYRFSCCCCSYCSFVLFEQSLKVIEHVMAHLWFVSVVVDYFSFLNKMWRLKMGL